VSWRFDVLSPVPVALDRLPLRIDRGEVLRFLTQCRRCWMGDCAYRRAPAVGSVSR
jgi:hypothetical protein